MSSRIRYLLQVTCALLLLGAHAASAEELRKPKDPKSLEHLSRGNQLLKIGPASAQEAADEYKAGLMIEYAPIFENAFVCSAYSKYSGGDIQNRMKLSCGNWLVTNMRRSGAG